MAPLPPPRADCNVSPIFSDFLQAGKFDIIPTMTTIGSGIGIFGVVSSDISSFYMETLKLFSLLVASVGKCPRAAGKYWFPLRQRGKGERRCSPASLALENRFLPATG